MLYCVVCVYLLFVCVLVYRLLSSDTEKGFVSAMLRPCEVMQAIV